MSFVQFEARAMLFLDANVEFDTIADIVANLLSRVLLARAHS